MISSIVSRLVILVFGTLYPAYASYKAVRSRDVREYVKWMMYWIVFALFTCGETITDVFLSFWFPFYYEIKIGFVLWLLSPATKGSSILYRKFVHPMLTNREQEIDEYIARAKEQGYHTVLHLGSRGVNYATNVIMQTAIKGGGGLVNQLRKSYSLSDLTDGEGEPVRDVNRNGKDVDGLEYRGNRRPDRVDGPRSSNRARGYSPRRSASGSARMEMYFPEVDVDVRQRRGSSRSRETSVPLSHIRSSEDVSSGYTSGDHFYEDAVQMDVDQATEDPASLPVVEGPLVRTASVGSTRSTRTKGSTSARGGATSTTAKKATQGEHVDGSSSEEEDLWSDPLDHVPPLLDRTLFVNDLNTFPMHQPKLAVEFISSSAELSQTPSTGVEVVNENLSSIFIDNQPNVDDERVTKLVPIEIKTPLSELSNSKSSHGLNDDPEAMNVDALKNPLLVAREDIKSDLSSPSDCLMLEKGNQELTSESSLELVSEEKNIVNNIKKSSTVSAEESPGPEIPSISQDIISNSIVTAADDSIAENKEPPCTVASSVNAAGLVSKLTSEEATVLTTGCNEPSVSSEPTLALATVTPVVIEETEHQILKDAAKVASAIVTPVIIEQTEHKVLKDAAKIASASVTPVIIEQTEHKVLKDAAKIASASVTPVIIEQTEHKVLKDASKVASATVTPVIIEHTEHLVMENTSNTSASMPKENLAAGPRGGKYNKRPAPEPPQDNDKSRGSSAEPDFKGQDAVHARLVLQRGIVRSLPDVGLASSDDPLVRSEVFVAVNAPKHSSLSPSSHANLLPKPNGADRFVGEILSKSPMVKENAGVGFPQFLNLPGRPHFGSLTSLFPFWHGGTSTETSSVVSHKKIGENTASNEKMPTGIVECKEVKGGSQSSKKVGSEDKPKVPSRVSRAGKSDAAERGRDEVKKHFPVRQLSHSPSRANRRF